jgi:hypothetical protein
MHDVHTQGASSAVAQYAVSNPTSNPDADSQTFDRIELFCKMRQEYKPFVRKAIWRVLQQCIELGADYRTLLEIESDVWAKVFEDFDAWLKPGFSNSPSRKPAKLSTRLSEAAKWQALGWKKAQLRNRAKFVSFEDGERIEHFLFLKFEGYGRFYPENLKARSLDETPERLKRANNPIPFDHAARFLCAECGALKPLAEGFIVEQVVDPAFTLQCGHARRLSGSVACDSRMRAAA